MKIEKLSDANYKVYIYDINLDDDDLYNEIKNILKKLQKELSLKGFYKVIAFYLKCGLFLDLILLEKTYYRDTVDFKIIFDDNRKVYFKTKDYFLIDELATIRYYDGYYYGLVDNSFDKLIEKVEFGDFVFNCDDSNMITVI